jgi:hypothetical protein
VVTDKCEQKPAKNNCTKVEPNIESIAFCHPFVQVLAAVKSYRYVDSFHHFCEKNVAMYPVCRSYNQCELLCLGYVGTQASDVACMSCLGWHFGQLSIALNYC